MRYALALLTVAATPALADWKQDYARGLESAKSGRWEEVQRFMQSALAGSTEPATRLRLYGQRYEIYAPQHYAGLAALRLGSCAEALRFWSQGGNESFISGFPELADAERQGRQECGSRLVEETQPPPPVVAITEEKDPVAESPTTSRPVSSRSASSRTQSSRSAVPPTETPPFATTPAQPPPRPVVQATEAKPPVVESVAKSSMSAQIVRPLLDAYLGGRYADVLKLSASVPPASRLSWHMLTLRAAAAYNLAQIEPSADVSKIARQAADDARRSDPALKPDADFFSPKFISFFASK